MSNIKKAKKKLGNKEKEVLELWVLAPQYTHLVQITIHPHPSLSSSSQYSTCYL